VKIRDLLEAANGDLDAEVRVYLNDDENGVQEITNWQILDYTDGAVHTTAD
jgi:hypothetical protein